MRGARPRTSICAAILIACLAAGCGGSKYTKSDFITRADAICTNALRQSRSIPGGSELPTYLGDLVPVLRAEETQLRALPRPPGTAHDRAALERYYAALSHVVQDYQRLAAAAKRGDQDAVTGLEADLQASPVYSLASSYGLRSCGTPGSTAV